MRVVREVDECLQLKGEVIVDNFGKNIAGHDLGHIQRSDYVVSPKATPRHPAIGEDCRERSGSDLERSLMLERRMMTFDPPGELITQSPPGVAGLNV